MSTDRKCEECGEAMVRIPGMRTRVFLTKRFCSYSCGSKSQRAYQYDSPEAITMASHELLKRLLRYGLRNDGLPGLPATELLRLSGELGITAHAT